MITACLILLVWLIPVVVHAWMRMNSDDSFIYNENPEWGGLISFIMDDKYEFKYYPYEGPRSLLNAISYKQFDQSAYDGASVGRYIHDEPVMWASPSMNSFQNYFLLVKKRWRTHHGMIDLHFTIELRKVYKKLEQLHAKRTAADVQKDTGNPFRGIGY